MTFEQLSVDYIIIAPELKGKLGIVWSCPCLWQPTHSKEWIRCTATIWMYCLNCKWAKHRSKFRCNRLHPLKTMLYIIYMYVCMLYCNWLGGLKDILACLLFWMSVYMMYRIYPRVFLLQPLLSIIQYFGTPVFQLFSFNCTASCPNE